MTVDEALSELTDRRGWRPTLIGTLAGGEVGAAAARLPDGRRAVVKVLPRTVGSERAMTEAREQVDALRLAGYPAPAYLFVEPLSEGILVGQEFVSGAWSDVVSAEVVARVLEVNELQSGRARGERDWPAYVLDSLRDGFDGYCEHTSLATHSSRTRRLLRRIRSIGAAAEIEQFPDGDATHLDFHHRNVLQADGALTAIVDNEGFGRGDRYFDLTTFAFCLEVATVAHSEHDAVWGYIRSRRSRLVVAAYVAHQALRQVDWSIRRRSCDQLERWLRRSEWALDRFGSAPSATY